MKKKKKKKLILDICIIICACTFAFSAYKIYEFEKNMQTIESEQQEVDTIIEEATTTEESRFTKETYDKLKNMNKDYVCYLEFDSQLISLPVVQTDNNDYYLTHSFKKKSSSQGAIFIDARNLLTDTNITIYGHYVYADKTKMFSPLSKLKKQANYENNRLLKLYFEDEVREYEVAYVYEYDYTETNYDYTKRNFASQEAIDTFFAYPEKYQYYDTNINIEYGDSFITFQTCVKNQKTKRLIVVAKEKK